MQTERKILVTGAFGQIGSELVPALQARHGVDQVIAMGNRNIPSDFQGIVEKADIRNKSEVLGIIEKHDIGTVYHLVSLLSATGEKDPTLTWDVNMTGLKDVLDIAVEKELKVFWPSSIAAFGPTTPRDNTPQHTILEPTTMYGVTKVAGENVCNYYHKKYGLDVRSVRYPGIISWKTPPGGGTTDYAVAIFYEGLEKESYDCFVKPETTLPMMYMDDAVRATMDIMEAPSENIKVRNSYNLAAISFTAEELATELKKFIPKLEVTYTPDHRQNIADSWPKSIDDSEARADWGWKHEFDLPRMTEVMVENLKKKLGK